MGHHGLEVVREIEITDDVLLGMLSGWHFKYEDIYPDFVLRLVHFVGERKSLWGGLLLGKMLACAPPDEWSRVLDLDIVAAVVGTAAASLRSCGHHGGIMGPGLVRHLASSTAWRPALAEHLARLCADPRGGWLSEQELQLLGARLLQVLQAPQLVALQDGGDALRLLGREDVAH